MLYHAAPAADWKSGVSPYRPKSLDDEGFIHCSYWRQLPAIVNTLFHPSSEVVVLEIDPELVGHPVRDEDCYQSGEQYPHIYGEFCRDAVTGVLQVEWDRTGARFVRVLEDNGELQCVPVGDHPADEVLALLARLNAQLIVDEGHDNPMDRAALVARMTEFVSGSYRAYLFEKGGVVGYALVDHGRSPLYLRQFFIQRGLRRGGYGKQALELLWTKLGTSQMSLEVLSRNVRGIRFWHLTGFRDRFIRMERPDTNDVVRDASSGTHWSAEQLQRAADHSPPDTARLTPTDPAQTPSFDPASADTQIRVGDVTQETAFILEGLKAHNDTLSPFHRAARDEGQISGIAVMLLDGSGEWLGGVVGECYWDWLEVNDLWIGPIARGHHLGSLLISEIERFACDRGARHAQLHTFSFQARGFYEKHGYRVVGELTGFPPGESLYWMRKELDSQEEPA
jgi:uncharacterized protein (DUF952 family)/GNAT superfamily N-acetyltransferase